MKVWTYSIMWREATMLPYFIRHYKPWVDRMVVLCEPSDDGTEKILKSCRKVDFRPWPYRGLDDEKFMNVVNNLYKEARGKADWVAFVDADELLWHPNMLKMLAQADGDIFPTKGYALISPTGWPQDDGKSQLYELVKTGIPQPNYNKKLLHRPSLNIVHTIGRHTYSNKPIHDGKECTSVGMRLIHCHHVGGVDWTAERNQRNYDRVLDKRYAWNYADNNNFNERQVGTVAWVQAAIKANKLMEVV